MPRRYFSQRETAGDWWAEPPPSIGFTVFEQETGPVKTGLLDKHGVPIYATNDKPSIGFVRFGSQPQDHPMAKKPMPRKGGKGGRC